MESISGSIRQACPFGRARTTLLYVLFLGSAGHLNSRSWAQEECEVTRTTPIQVENATGVGMLRAAANCTGGGSLEADWAGAITLDAPISIAPGIFLSITGEDTLAEVRGGSQTRMFEVSHSAGLTLTHLKLSGGAAESGGAIYSDSAALFLDSCLFHGNVATDGDGGAVWADGGNVTISGGEFLDNDASRYGGAVCATGAVTSLVVQDGSIFEGNEALVGGALYCSGVAESRLARCSLNDTAFTSNTATFKGEDTAFGTPSEGVEGGGAVSFLFASANITDSVFGGNYAEYAGGVLLGGNGTDITITGCKFENNTAVEYGGAIAAATVTLGGGTQLTNNSATSGGGAVFGWASNGSIVFNAVTCTRNTVNGYGGCFHNAGTGMVNNGTFMLDNQANNGGCIYTHSGSELTVVGGDFMCRSTRRGGFLHVEGGTSVKITGGTISNNVAGTRGGAIFCKGFTETTLTIEGGTFKNNSALEFGGALTAMGEFASVQIIGGMFSNNTATYTGGCVFLDEVASFACERATIRYNYAGDQGGGIYARSSTWLNSSCDLIGNQSPQGAALYLTNVESVTLANHTVANNLAFSGSVLYMTESSVIANGVSFISDVGLQDDSSNRAVQSDSNSALTAKECVFDGWLGDTVIYHRSSGADSLSLDNCDFSGSSAIMAVFSLNSDANIRNAVVDDSTLANAGRVNNSLALVNRALDCANPNVCGPGMCVDSALGVLCECLDIDMCLDGGGDVSLGVKTPPANETYDPDTVSFELVVSSAGDGTTYAIWEVAFDADYLELDVAPSSGILPPGGNITVAVTGTPVGQDLGGILASRFNITSMESTSSTSTPGATLEVRSTFFLCPAYKYAEPLAAEDGGVLCEPCISIEGGEGVDCASPGATLASLPIRPGYWRSSRESLAVHKCGHSQACAGATEILSADDYCKKGYQGPYCAVCSAGYGRSVSNTCHSCDSPKAQLFLSAGIIFCAVMVLLSVFLGVVFLVGGHNAVDTVHTSVTRTFSMASMVPKVWPLSQTSVREQHYPERGARQYYSTSTVAPAFDFTWERQCRTESHPTVPWPDDAESANVRPVRVSDIPEGAARDALMPDSGHTQQTTEAGAGVDGALVHMRAALEANSQGKSKCCGPGVNIKCWGSRLPLDEIKILAVVWQILAGFSSITGVEFPASYSTFLSWINVVNLDIGQTFSASCILPSVNFYVRLLVTTLTPLVLAAGLVLTYQMAKRRAGIGSAGVIARRAAWSRHVAAGLLLTFLVFTSSSTLVLKTFACDDAVRDGRSYLRADYSLSCESSLHTSFKRYAMFMILVYPIGIPALYAVIVWRKRELLNPQVHTAAMPAPDETEGTATRADFAEGAGIFSWFIRTVSKGQTKNELSLQELQESKERVRARREHPDLTPSMFLWKDYGPDVFYYEVIECGRRIVLTGVLIFIAPNSSTQVAAACVFAFGSLLGFELMRPHLDPASAWLYRLGCVVIFLSYFLALLIKVDVAGEGFLYVLGGLLVAINVILVLAVLFTSWFTVQHSADSSRDEVNTRTFS